eukprot:m.896441 g.896441  ORF g.896441 m.896441 type:complete len:318 (-) comp60011_c0_seq1:2170-3123(-)
MHAGTLARIRMPCAQHDRIQRRRAVLRQWQPVPAIKLLHNLLVRPLAVRPPRIRADLVQRDAKAPHIRRSRVALEENRLRCRPSQRNRPARRPVIVVVKHVAGKPKVRNLDAHVVANQTVARCHVSVDKGERVQVRHSAGNVGREGNHAHHVHCLVPSRGCAQPLVQGSVGQQLQHNLDRLAFRDHTNQGDHILVVELGHDDCLLQKLDLRLARGFLQQLYSHREIDGGAQQLRAGTLVDLAKAALANQCVHGDLLSPQDLAGSAKSSDELVDILCWYLEHIGNRHLVRVLADGHRIQAGRTPGQTQWTGCESRWHR